VFQEPHLKLLNLFIQGNDSTWLQLQDMMAQHPNYNYWPRGCTRPDRYDPMNTAINASNLPMVKHLLNSDTYDPDDLGYKGKRREPAFASYCILAMNFKARCRLLSAGMAAEPDLHIEVSDLLIFIRLIRNTRNTIKCLDQILQTFLHCYWRTRPLPYASTYASTANKYKSGLLRNMLLVGLPRVDRFHDTTAIDRCFGDGCDPKVAEMYATYYTNRVWTWQYHNGFHIMLRKAVSTVLLCMQSWHNDETRSQAALLPPEIVFLILKQIAPKDFVDPEYEWPRPCADDHAPPWASPPLPA
jgi:hypothetical protein